MLECDNPFKLNRDEHHNQLRFVCRQLYTETNGLEFKLNTIVFNAVDKRLARTFLKAAQVPYVAKYLYQFRKVKLLCGHGEYDGFDDWAGHVHHALQDSPKDLIRLSELCRGNEQMKVRYTLADFQYTSKLLQGGHEPPADDSSDNELLARAVFFSMLYRGKDYSNLLPEFPTIAERFIDEATHIGSLLEEQAQLHEKLASNLRFFPVFHCNRKTLSW